jgi:hypothetical protein
MGEKLRRADELHGRITLNIFTLSYTGTPDRKAWCKAFGRAFSWGGFMPRGCDDLRQPPVFRRYAVTWVDDSKPQELTAEDPLSSPGHQLAVCYFFWRWNGPGAGPEREEASFDEPGSHEHWARAVRKATPPIETWKQERWHIEVAPCCIDPGSEDEDEDEEEGEEEKEEGEKEEEEESRVRFHVSACIISLPITIITVVFLVFLLRIEELGWRRGMLAHRSQGSCSLSYIDY